MGGSVRNLILHVVKDPRGHHPARQPDLSNIVEWLKEQMPEPDCLGVKPIRLFYWPWDLS